MRRRGTTAQRGSANGARSGAGHRPVDPREHLRFRPAPCRIAWPGMDSMYVPRFLSTGFQGLGRRGLFPHFPPIAPCWQVKRRLAAEPTLNAQFSPSTIMTGVSLLRRAAVGTLAGVLACRYTTELAGASSSAKTAAVTLNTGARMPALGFGTYLLTGDACRSAVLAALRAGYRHIDTAAGYLNEAQVAEALEESGLRREEVFIASKLWSDSHGTEATRRAIRTPHRAPTQGVIRAAYSSPLKAFIISRCPPQTSTYCTS